VAITAPVPRPPHRFWRCCDRWMTLSRHPGSRPDLEPLWSDSIRVANCLFARRACRRVTADIRPDLDPRSLDPDRSFWSAFAELIWSQTSPTDFCNCYDERALCPSSHDPRWDDHLDGLPVLTPHALSLAEAVRRGEPRIVRSIRPRCRFLLVAQVCPTAISTRSRHLRELPRGVAVAIDVHGSEDQVKDASLPVHERAFLRLLTPGACTSKSACGRNVPFLGILWTSAVAGAAPRGEEPRSRLEPNRT